MIDLSSLPHTVTVPVGFLGGLLLGYGYFRALRETAALIVAQGHPLLGLALTLGRMAVLVAVFTLAALAGGLVLLAALAGVLCAKALLLRRTRIERA